jgi:two-component system sensor histidine kinase AlgZ
VRVGERLLVERAIDDESFRRLLPPLLLQPLVENAVTHGISNMLEGGTVRISARAEGSRLIVAIENPRDPEARRRAGAGLGLTNVRRRLEAAYGREATVNVEAVPDRFRVELSLPSPPPEPIAAPPAALPATAAPEARLV